MAINSGVRFVDDALERGASALVPDEQHAALAALASLVRSRSEAQVVAVVGSVGKTSTKDALGALSAAVTPTVYAEASQNNEIGLPLTVLRLEPETRVLVTEMGMRGAGQVAELCSIARPRVVVVTAIGPEHLELVGTVEDVAAANAEAIAALPPGGVAIVPAGTHPSSSHTCDGTTSTCVASTPLTWRGTSLVMMEHKATRRPRGGDFGSATPSSRWSCRSRSVITPRTCSQPSSRTTRSGCPSTARTRARRASGSRAGAAK